MNKGSFYYFEDNQEYLDTFNASRNELCDIIKSLLYEADNTVFEKIDFYDDKIYLEPMLFSYFNFMSGTSYPLYQILYGYCESDKRPNKLNILTNKDGVAYLPKVGYFKTDAISTLVELTEAHGEYLLESEGKDLPFEFHEICYLGNSGIELNTYENPIYINSFMDSEGNFIGETRQSHAAQKNMYNLHNSIEFLSKNCTEMFVNIKRTVRSIILFDSEKKNSFAHFSANGAIYLNVYGSTPSTVHFIEDVTHQSAHVYFNVLTHDKEMYFNIDPEIKLYEADGDRFRNDGRSVYVLFHAIYTYIKILHALERYLMNEEGDNREALEAFGRLSYTLFKFNMDLTGMQRISKQSDTSIFTERGRDLFEEMEKANAAYNDRWQEPFAELTFNNQPYNFDYDRFISANPHVSTNAEFLKVL